MREPEERDLEAAFAALPAALRADDSGSLHTAVLSAAYRVEESDPELGVDSLTDWFWNEMIDRLTSPSTLTLGWTGGMIGGGSVSLWLLPATATSVWTIEIDGAAETYQPPCRVRICGRGRICGSLRVAVHGQQVRSGRQDRSWLVRSV